MITKLAGVPDAVENALEELDAQQTVSRIWAGDHTVWKTNPDEITNRLGWLYSPNVMQGNLSEIEAFVEQARSDNFTHALLLGMGGSSLAPEVFRKTFGVKEGFLDLAVLDSTDPDAISVLVEDLNPNRTLYIVATKSGGTVETLSLFKYFYNRVLEVVGEEQAGKHFVAITDPGSKLQGLADRLKFRATFLNDPNIGGRYSALSYFGLVPAALIGVDLRTLLDRASTMAETCQTDLTAAENPGAQLGVILGELAKLGKDKLTFVLPSEIDSFGDWVEQLIAESTGKEGKGILPVVGESVASVNMYREDRLFVEFMFAAESALRDDLSRLSEATHPFIRLGIKDAYDLGGQFFLWEFATAVAGHRLGINPFDQPNVESAKKLARKMVASYLETGSLAEEKSSFERDGLQVYYRKPGSDEADIEKFDVLEDALTDFLDAGQDGGYLAIQAYVQPTPEMDYFLAELRDQIRSRTHFATTVGYGPRFLHSTGQLHKGDSGMGLFLQITSEPESELSIPDEAGEHGGAMDFGVLKIAQAIGDREALLAAGREVMRIHVHPPILSSLESVLGVIKS